MRVEDKHFDMVLTLAKSGSEIAATVTADSANLLHHAIGICSEAGEILDRVKKVVIYNQPLDMVARENLIEELGDIEFYLTGLRAAIAVGREETLRHNMDKLAIRYENYEYSDEAARVRADKVEDAE